MAKYLTPLPALLAATLETAVNRLLAMDENSPRRLQQVNGRRVLLQMEGLGIDLWFRFTAHRVRVSLDPVPAESDSETTGEDDEISPDTTISGTPVALFSMAVPDGDGAWGLPGSRVKISGDATLARDLERLFSRLEPDWEGQLSGLLGDVMGHQVAAGARGAVQQAREAAKTMESITTEYFSRPQGPLAQGEEIREFSEAVDSIRDATDRLEARIRVLKQRREQNGPSGDNSE